MNTTIKYTLLVLGCAFLGFFSYHFFFEYSLSLLKSKTIEFNVSKMTSLLPELYIFSLSIGSIPLFYLLSDRFAKYESWQQTLEALVMIVSMGLLLWLLRIVYLLSTTQKMGENVANLNLQNSISVDELHLSIPLLLGLMLGTLFSTLYFKRKNRKG